jgi:23S rRNA (cytidine1920-2'-O)/16S rRNA (cytidine1409-2'-O)-methyltransferase
MPKKQKIRIDQLLVKKGLAPSREKAVGLIMSGAVLVNDKPATKAGQTVDEDANIRITGAEHPFVGRGGVKLAHALKEFGIDPAGKVCVDVGASTGGFSDCLLQGGAKKVYAIDVGYGQLDWKVRSDEKVVVIERTNIRELPDDLKKELASQKIGIIVVDVSFISLTKVMPHLDPLISKGTDVVALIKPQFEVGRGSVGKGGIVRDESLRQSAVDEVSGFAIGLGWARRGLCRSPITGADGNVEFLAWFVK